MVAWFHSIELKLIKSLLSKVRIDYRDGVRVDLKDGRVRERDEEKMECS